MTDDLKITKLLPEHSREAAELHISGIHKGFISSLGIDFVAALYEAIAESKFGFGFVTQKDGKIMGFAAFTTNLNALYKSVILKNGLRLAFKLAGKMFSFGRIKKVFETMFYPSRIKKMNLPSAEFLSMVVVEEARGKGLATAMMWKGFAECARRGEKKVKILARADLKAINKMYEKYGFELVGQIESHGVVSNVYVTETDRKQVDEKTL